MFNKKPPQKSIVEQAQEVRSKELAKEIDTLSDTISEYMKNEIAKTEMEIGLYKVILEAIIKKTDNWFNQQINNRKFKDLLKQDDNT